MSGSHDLPCQMIRPLRSESKLSYSIREDDLAGNRAGGLRSRGLTQSPMALNFEGPLNSFKDVHA
jgi:hypothetical protein